MTKVAQDFEIWSGRDDEITFTITDNNSASVDLTGASVYWSLSEKPTSASLIRKTTDSGSGISVSGCTFTVSIYGSDTSGLRGRYYHEGAVRDSSGSEQTVAIGTAEIHPSLA